MEAKLLLRLKSSCTDRGTNNRSIPWITPSGRITSSGRVTFATPFTILSPVFPRVNGK
ncbi:hypothetical protein HanRHA438_Chr07g0314121 [Helianthus annuus]|nr:hypothetical protein HanIR_Chr07g0328401 [Helianthus annuus]KAJ0908768.1 hypothetical protein HanRHA438_Chr07g0314121 [Helianthus annuus]